MRVTISNCNQCNLSFPTKSALAQHKLIAHNNMIVNPIGNNDEQNDGLETMLKLQKEKREIARQMNANHISPGKKMSLEGRGREVEQQLEKMRKQQQQLNHQARSSDPISNTLEGRIKILEKEKAEVFRQMNVGDYTPGRIQRLEKRRANIIRQLENLKKMHQKQTQRKLQQMQEQQQQSLQSAYLNNSHSSADADRPSTPTDVQVYEKELDQIAEQIKVSGNDPGRLKSLGARWKLLTDKISSLEKKKNKSKRKAIVDAVFQSKVKSIFVEPNKQDSFEILDSDDESAIETVKAVNEKTCEQSEEANLVCIHIETFRVSNEPGVEITQVGCTLTELKFVPGQAERNYFRPVKPAKLEHYLTNYKLEGDLLRALHMTEAEGGRFEYRTQFEARRSGAAALYCSGEREAMVDLFQYLQSVKA